jgi:hypothetical protein
MLDQRCGRLGRIGRRPGGPDSTPSSFLSEREQSAILNEAIPQLPPAEQAVVLCRAQDRLPFRRMGPLVGRSAQGARPLWRQAIARLKLQDQAASPRLDA